MPAQPSRLKIVQLAISALIGGIAVLSLAAVLFTQNSPTEPMRPAPGDAQEQVLPEPSLTLPLGIVAVALALGAAILPLIVVRPMSRRAGARWKTEGQTGERARDAVLAQFQVCSYARAAAPAALGVFSAAATILTGELAFLAGVGLAIVLIGMVFPSRARQEDFYRAVTGGPPPAET